MEIKQLDVADLLRFLITGFWSYFIYALAYHDPSSLPISNDNSLFFAFVLFAIGAIQYFAFRSLIFPVLVWLIDLKVPNARTYIRDRFSIKGWITANDLWQVYQGENIDKFKGSYKPWHASIHMLWITSTTTLFGAVYYCCFRAAAEHDPVTGKMLWLLFAVLFSSSVTSQIMYETRVLNHLKTHVPDAMTSLIDAWKKSQTSNAA
jgi:multisubunit Na+/H+ antiporter MnhG subunit